MPRGRKGNSHSSTLLTDDLEKVGDKGAKTTEEMDSSPDSLRAFISKEFVKISGGYETVMGELKEFRKDMCNITAK